MKFTTQDKIIYAFAGLCLLYLIVSYPWSEHMTNKDVQDKKEYHDSKPSDWSGKKKPEKQKKQSENEIMGPKAQPIDPNEPKPSDGGNGKNGSGVYPEIYGPDFTGAPGHKDTTIKGQGGESDSPPDYDYVPAAEFPAGPSQPEPYLNDFSNILKYN